MCIRDRVSAHLGHAALAAQLVARRTPSSRTRARHAAAVSARPARTLPRHHGRDRPHLAVRGQ
eukprot:3143642-Alexandrium_andersonii.AAC.1